jgi:hypothetical protein
MECGITGQWFSKFLLPWNPLSNEEFLWNPVNILMTLHIICELYNYNIIWETFS